MGFFRLAVTECATTFAIRVLSSTVIFSDVRDSDVIVRLICRVVKNVSVIVHELRHRSCNFSNSVY